ncbi:hypothetical protein AB4K20DRAFT_1892383 [Rhizopus microsporus]
MVKSSCNVHKFRNLSVHKRTVFLSTLLFSTIWYVSRVTWTPKGDLGHIATLVTEKQKKAAMNTESFMLIFL